MAIERYWIAEHHATGAFASPAPEVLIARVGAETSHIRVGSGGVMLPHYSPMKVAETFRVLHALYPGRIDLGIGRAPGGSPLDSFALRRDRSAQPTEDDFPKQLLELIAFLHGGFRPDHAFSRIELSPAMPGSPEVWLLGSSMWSAAAAAQLGLPYAFAHFIDPTHTRAAIEYYRSHFIRSNELSAPRRDSWVRRDLRTDRRRSGADGLERAAIRATRAPRRSWTYSHAGRSAGRAGPRTAARRRDDARDGRMAARDHRDARRTSATRWSISRACCTSTK